MRLFSKRAARNVSKQFDVALAKFTECLEDTSAEKAPGEVGLLYHQIGNCLVKLKDPNEAIHAYSQALVDTSYDASGSVSYNLGMVYASQGDFEDAITNFKAVTEDSRYATPYKAYVPWATPCSSWVNLPSGRRFPCGSLRRIESRSHEGIAEPGRLLHGS